MRNIKYVIRDIPYRIRLIKWSLERAIKGYTTWDIAGPGFDATYAKYIGHSLIWLGQNNHGAPGGYPQKDCTITEPTDFEAWSADLIRHGQALVDLSKDIDFTDEETSYYNNMTTEPVYDSIGGHRIVFPTKSEQFVKDTEARRLLEERRHKDASEAFIWISKWHGSLWD